MITLEWIVWGLLLLITLLYSAGHYVSAVKRGKKFHKATPKIILTGWIFIILFIFIDVSKFHILWLYPISIIIINYLVLQKAFNKLKKIIKNDKLK